MENPMSSWMFFIRLIRRLGLQGANGLRSVDLDSPGFSRDLPRIRTLGHTVDAKSCAN
jgi:hypothetical protein